MASYGLPAGALDELEIRWSLGGEGDAVVPVAEPAVEDRAEGNAQRTGGIGDCLVEVVVDETEVVVAAHPYSLPTHRHHRLVDVAACWSWRLSVLV